LSTRYTPKVRDDSLI